MSSNGPCFHTSDVTCPNCTIGQQSIVSDWYPDWYQQPIIDYQNQKSYWTMPTSTTNVITTQPSLEELANKEPNSRAQYEWEQLMQKIQDLENSTSMQVWLDLFKFVISQHNAGAQITDSIKNSIKEQTNALFSIFMEEWMIAPEEEEEEDE